MIVDPARLVSRARSLGRFAAARVADRRDRQFNRIAAQVRAGMQLPALPQNRRQTGTVWAVTMVKNEADIIEASVRHLFEQGITAAIIADNGSTDETPEILRRLATEFPIYLATDTEVNYYQGHKMSLLADSARRAGADWIVPFDADEFWFAPSGTLAGWLRTVDADVVSALMYNVFPSSSAASGWVMDVQSHIHPKVAFRAVRGAQLGAGNHAVSHPGEGRAGLLIAHQPWRGYAQLARKLRQGAVALDGAELHFSQGAHWRAGGRLNDAELHSLWTNLADGVYIPTLGWSPIGELRDVGADPADWMPTQFSTRQLAAGAPPAVGYAVPAGMDWDDVTTAARALAARVGTGLAVAPHSTPSRRARIRHRLFPSQAPEVLLAARAASLDAALGHWRAATFRAAWVMTDARSEFDVSVLPANFVDRLVVPSRELADRLRKVSLSEPIVVPWRTDVRGVRLPAQRSTDVLIVRADDDPEPILPAGLAARFYTPRVLTVFERQLELRAALADSRCVIASNPRVLTEATDLGAIALPAGEVTPDLVAEAVASWTPERAREQWRAAAENPDGQMIDRVVSALFG